jgi:hypothetical protein
LLNAKQIICQALKLCYKLKGKKKGKNPNSKLATNMPGVKINSFFSFVF